MHISDRNERNWLLNKIENEGILNTTKEHKLKIFDRLCENESFNLFCKTKFPTSKRFGIEGCDSLISGLRHLVETTK
jgi:2-oxoglutarate dehydrogenase E1 component